MIEEEYISEWVESISVHHPDLNGFSICPFSKSYTHKVIKSPINDIKPLSEEYGVVIFIVEDNLELDFIKEKCKNLSKKYENYIFFEDCASQPTFIGKKQTNNQKYNLVLYQDKKFLSNLREKLASTTYYDAWNDEYLRKILDYDYEMVQKIRNK
jgi:hypothetical protein